MSSTQDFAELAERYCALIEGAGRSDPRRFLERVEDVLSRAVAAAAALPDVAPESDASPAERMTTDEWQERFAELKSLLGPYDHYRRTLDPGTEPVDVNLADDLLSIYRDLTQGLQFLRSGAPPADVIFDWRFSFTAHWAWHAEGALKAIRAALDAS